jgi:acyl dehydratase
MTTPWRFGSDSREGWSRGVDVIAYMMHLPVAKWGRGFLERGLIEARFVKPVYDGETAEVSCEERDGVLSLQVESRGEP